MPPFNFQPFHSRCQQANLRIEEFQCVILTKVIVNTTVTGGILDGAKKFASIEVRRLHRTKIHNKIIDKKAISSKPPSYLKKVL